MRFIIPLAVAVGLGTSGLAFADIAAREQKAGAQPRVISEAELKAQMDNLGYDVRRFNAEDRHYEVYLIDRASGGAVEAKFDKATGDLVGAKLAQDNHEVREREDARERHERRKSDEIRERVGGDRDARAHERRDSED
jgi:hypothetical protein